jgi:hypothetical protein
MLDKTIAKDIQFNGKYEGAVEKKSLLVMGQI